MHVCYLKFTQIKKLDQFYSTKLTKNNKKSIQNEL